MKRWFSILLVCFVNVPADFFFFHQIRNVLVPAFPSISLFPSPYFFLCQLRKPFFLSPDLHSSLLYPFLSLFLILQAVKAEQTSCSENKTERAVSETEPRHCSPCLSHFLSFSLSVSLFLIKWSTCLLGCVWRGFSLQGISYVPSSPLLSAPLLSRGSSAVLRCDISFLWAFREAGILLRL